MITCGVDLSAEPKRTAIARIEWQPGGAVLTSLQLGAGDDAIHAAVQDSEKTGIDCPFGWPDAFVDFVNSHRDSSVVTPQGMAGKDWRRELAYRITDAEVRQAVGLIPLSVSADRIAHPAMRCASILAGLAMDGVRVERAGSGPVIEVYPAAALKVWGLPHRGYKRDPIEVSAIVDALLNAVPWLSLGEFEALCRQSDDAFDAVIASLVARAASRGAVTQPSAVQLPSAQREGWICIPTGTAAELLTE